MTIRNHYIRKEYPIQVCAYMAGILDGEGSLTISNYSCNKINGDKHYQVNIGIACIDKILIDWISETFGGFVGKYSPKQLAKNCRRDVYRWQCSGDRLTHICEITYPFLVIKKRECEILIEIRKTFNGSQNIKGMQNTQRLTKEILDIRHSLYLELKSLHQRNYKK